MTQIHVDMKYYWLQDYLEFKRMLEANKTVKNNKNNALDVSQYNMLNIVL